MAGAADHLGCWRQAGHWIAVLVAGTRNVRSQAGTWMGEGFKPSLFLSWERLVITTLTRRPPSLRRGESGIARQPFTEAG